jgi:hypothetical protein
MRAARVGREGKGSVERKTLVHVKLPTGHWLAGWFAPRTGRREPLKLRVAMTAVLDALGADPSELTPVLTDELVLRVPAGTVMRRALAR